MDRLPLKGKVAIVTGASRGIGAGVALELAKRGAHYSSLISTIEALNNGSTAISVEADLRSTSAPSKILSAALAAYPDSGISILVNNAGCELAKPLAEIDVSDLSYVYDLNVRAPLLMLQAILPHLQRPGRIINIGSIGARKGFKGFSLYCSSKAALEGLTRCWAAELGGQGHTVNCVNPGPTETDMVANIDPDIVGTQKKTTPVENRLGTVEDVARIVAWLAQEESAWGQRAVLEREWWIGDVLSRWSVVIELARMAVKHCFLVSIIPQVVQCATWIDIWRTELPAIKIVS